jgi:hypothetical protein
MESFLQSEQFVGVMGMFTGIVLFGTPMIAYFWYRLRVKQWEMSLKYIMLERGMSADEIKTVLEASAPISPRKHGCWTGLRNV